MPPLDITTNADDVANDLVGAVVDVAAERANTAAAAEAARLVDPRTPRRSGRLAAGLRVVVAEQSWALVNAVPYAPVVDARTGYATKTVLDNEARLVDIYNTELQHEFDRI